MAKSKALQQIIARAKQIRRASPSIKWISAVKKASAEYRGGSVKTSRPKAKARKRTRRVGLVSKGKRDSGGVFGGGAIQMVNGIKSPRIAMMKSALKENAKQKLASALLRRDLAKLKRDKKKIGKQVACYRKEVKRYS